jgi:DNA-binding beta-propeller fold protein YncE
LGTNIHNCYNAEIALLIRLADITGKNPRALVLCLSLSTVGIIIAMGAVNNVGLVILDKVYADVQFNQPEGVQVGSAGNVYVVDESNDRIQKFTNTGTLIRTWGTLGTGNGQFDGPNGIALDSSGNVYVTDFGNNRVQKFENDGTFIREWGSLGTGNGQFNGPTGIGINLNTNNVYVADEGNNRIQEFTNVGSFIRTWGSLGSAPISTVVASSTDLNPFKTLFPFG